MQHTNRTLRAFTGTLTAGILSASLLCAQEAPAPAAGLPENSDSSPVDSTRPLPQFKILETKVTQLPDRKLTIHRVADPGLPALTPLLPATAPVRLLPPLTPAQLAARSAARPAIPETRLLSLTVIRYADNLTYIEWWPHGGGEPFGAWSNADFDALRMVPDVEISPGNIRYLIFPYAIYNRTLQGPVAVPQLPAGGPGFLVVKGNAADAENVNPVAALHKIYKEEGAELKRAAQERERQRREEEALRAAVQAAPKDEVLYIWKTKPIRSKGGTK